MAQYNIKGESMRVLFVTEKWPRNNPSVGETSLYHTLFASLDELKIADIMLVHPDEWLLVNGETADAELLALVSNQQYCPDVIVYSCLSNQAKGPEIIGVCNPAFMTWVRIKNINPKVKLCGIWGDSAWYKSQEYIKYLLPVFDLHLTLDIKHPGEHEKILPLWGYPYSSELFYGDPNEERFIDVSFCGSVEGRPERAKALEELEKRGIKVARFGGQFEENLSFEEYATIFRQSKISLNFATVTSKGRAKEAILCGSCLFEPETSSTNNWLTPNEDYVAYKMVGEGLDVEPDFDVLAKTIKEYLKNDKKRLKVANQGYKTVQEKHNNAVWWNTVFTNLGIEREPTVIEEMDVMFDNLVEMATENVAKVLKDD